VTHAWANRGWRGETELLDGMARLAGVPGALVHGRLDVTGPVLTAWRLARAWPNATLTIVDDAGHLTSDGGMSAAIRAAIEAVAARIRPA
jgi:proline iminopeptidase